MTDEEIKQLREAGGTEMAFRGEAMINPRLEEVKFEIGEDDDD
jgi:hypothetical protein